MDSVVHSERRTERRGGELRTAQCLPCWNVCVLAIDCPMSADETHPRYGEECQAGLPRDKRYSLLFSSFYELKRFF